MNQATKQLQQAFAAAAAMPVEQQDLIALEILDRTQTLGGGPMPLSPEERSELQAAQAEARAGHRASDEAVARVYAKYGL